MAYVPDRIYTHIFEPGVVALDFDAPTEFFFAPNNGRAEMVRRVKEVVEDLSRKYGLGLYWLYETYSGVHAIFQCKLCSFDAALKVMEDANQREGFHECSGHLHFSDENGYVELRISHKPGREWDIFPHKLNPPASICPHVAEHEALLAKRMPAKVAA